VFAAGKTNTFLGERYRRIVKPRGKLKALVAVARLFAMACAHAGCGLPGLVRSASWRTWWISTGPTCPQASHWPFRV
jgi:hypothetical protein